MNPRSLIKHFSNSTTVFPTNDVQISGEDGIVRCFQDGSGTIRLIKGPGCVAGEGMHDRKQDGRPPTSWGLTRDEARALGLALIICANQGEVDEPS